jgi:outer membrane protein OmpA-like peptidoglycan-associated protein/LysM repeat protein
MKKYVALFLLIFSGSFFPDSATAQNKNPKIKPNANLIMGDKHFDNLEYYLASNEYARVLKADSSNAYAMFQLAESYRLCYNYKAAEVFYHKVAMRFKGSYPLARYWYAAMLKDNGDYKKAIENFEKYRNENNDTNLEIGLYRERAVYEIKGCYLAIAENDKPKRAYDFKCLPPPVNSLESDYSPVLIENDTLLAITTSRRGALGVHEDNSLGGSFSDVHRFSKKNDTLWEPIKHTHKDEFEKLNSQYNECSGSFTKNEKKYYFTRCDEIFVVDNYKEVNCAVYVSYNKNGKWESPRRLNENVNAPGQWNSQPSVSPDGNILFFVSKRPGGFGMHDIWYSTCNDDDQWGPPINLGDQVNTLFSDVSPRYYADEKVLFFSSTGHGGYGALDIFMTREDNGFEKSINIGYPFNTNRDDFYFVMGEKKGYVTSNREGGIGSDDIYTFNFKSRKNLIRHIEDSTATDDDEETSRHDKESREEAITEIPVNKYSDQKFAQVKGILLDSLTNKPAKAMEVRIIDEYGDAISKSLTTEKGQYTFYNLPTNKEYKIVLKNPDFNNKSYQILPPEIVYTSEVVQPKEPEELIFREFLITTISKDTIKNKKSFAVKGIVFDSITHAPVSKGQVQLIDEFGNVVQVSALDERGNYKVENVTDTKDYKIIYKAKTIASEKFNLSDYQLTFIANSPIPETTDALIAIIDETTLPEAKSITIDGIILYEDSRQPAADATILLADENGAALKTSKTDKNGYYKFSNLEEGNTYKVILHQGNLTGNSEDKKYLAEKVHVKGSDASTSKQLFENIFFDFDSYVLRNEAKKVLDDLIKYCKGDSSIQIELNANTDSYGSSQYNKILAANRGKAAMDYMISKGLSQSSMVVNSIGETKAAASNNTELGRQINRRIEFYILGASNIESKTVTHVIETNKTLYSLAKEYNMTVEELKDLNGLIGDELVAYTPVRVKRRAADNDIHGEYSRIEENQEKKNEKLEKELIEKNQSINKNFDYNKPEYKKYLDSIELADKNRMAGSPLYRGLNIGYYIAQPKNTLSQLAILYGMPVEKIKAINNLTSDTLSLNQKIKIDYDQRSPSVKGYVVKEGDTLEGIVNRFELSLPTLLEINKLEGYVLSTNMVIRFQEE